MSALPQRNDSSDNSTDQHAHLEHAIAARLLRLRDELIVRSHLAGMEASDATRALAGELDKLAFFFRDRVVARASAFTHDSKDRMYLQLLSNDMRLLEVEAELKSAFAQAASSTRAVVETARLKSALARMDAADAAAAAAHERTKRPCDLVATESKSAAVLEDISKRLTKMGVEASKIV